MKHLNFTLLLGTILLFGCNSNGTGSDNEHKDTTSHMRETVIEPASASPAIVIHGGAGSMEKEKFSEERAQTYQNALDTALRIGEKALEEGKEALEVVQSVLVYLENNPLFNSGKGAVLTAKGEAELDASLMDGKSLNCGAVAGVKTIKNPILAARYVMDSSAHVMLAGQGAEVFAREGGLEIVDNSYFITEKRKKRFEKIDKQGTVGCVVLDKNGNLAAGTSTGGMSNKKWGRIGDSPIIGAGTYADNFTCAVSCTGHGEYFIRKAVAHDVHARMKYGGQSLEEAAKGTLLEVEELGGTGGLIAVDAKGNIAMPFNTSGMFRAYSNKEGRGIKMFKD